MTQAITVAGDRFHSAPHGDELAARPRRKLRGPPGAKNDPVRLLSFVADARPDGGLGRHFWSPPICTDRSAGRHGYDMADELRAWVRAHPGRGPMLSLIVADMPRPLSALEIGFLTGFEGYPNPRRHG